jgi:hypothetical protein
MPHSAPGSFRFICLIVPALFLTGDAGLGLTQEGDEDDPFRPGLVATLRDSQGPPVVRVDAHLAFDWGEAAPDPRLGPGEFRATWQGNLLSQGRGDYRFSLFGTGEVELKVGGKVVIARRVLRGEWHESAPVALATGRQPIELSFRRTEKAARLTVLWSGPQFGPEPIPMRVLSHARRLAPGDDFERGRLLARALHCGHCHTGEAPSAPV